MLRHGHHWPRGKSCRTQAHRQLLEQLPFPHPWQDEVLREYLEAERAASERLQAIETRLLEEILPQCSLGPVVDSLVALTASYACNGCNDLCENTVNRRVAIADQLRYLIYYECYGKTERARELYRSIPATAREFSEGELDLACRVCPQGIDIPSRLRRAREVLA